MHVIFPTQMDPLPAAGYGGLGMGKEGLEYTVLVVTGWKGGRRNTANVHMKLTGSKDVSPVIHLDDGVRQVRRRWTFLEDKVFVNIR